MENAQLWGCILTAYILIFGCYYFFLHYKLESKKKSFPELTEEIDSEFTNISIAWCTGFAVILGLWKLGLPAVLVIILFAIGLFIYLIIWINRSNLLANKLFRGWIAGSILWFFAVGIWQVAFNRFSELDNDEAVVLGLTIPLFSAMAITGWKWVTKNK